MMLRLFLNTKEQFHNKDNQNISHLGHLEKGQLFNNSKPKITRFLNYRKRSNQKMLMCLELTIIFYKNFINFIKMSIIKINTLSKLFLF